MRVLDLGGLPRRPVDSSGSRGFTIGAFAVTAESHLVMVRLQPGGVTGRHPAAGRQLLVVVEGDAVVSGADDVEQALAPGQAAVWERGETHGTRTDGGLLALVVEGDLDVGAPGHEVDPGDT